MRSMHTIDRGTKARAALRTLAALLLLVSLMPAARAQQTERAKNLGKRMMCVCGCNQILTECNHVGCTYSYKMLKELDERVARNEPDDLTVQSFIQEYGATVMLMPEAKGFNLWAWIMPVVVPLVGLWLVWIVVMRWRRRAALAPAPKVSSEVMERARREAGGEGEV